MRFDPYDPELHQDPYPVYRRLREEFPVHYEPSRDFFVLSRYEDVLSALQENLGVSSVISSANSDR